MSYAHHEQASASREARLAVIFIDYQNLYTRLQHRLEAGASPDDYIAEALDELKRYLLDRDSTRTAQTLAYADFNALGSDEQLERGLYARSVDPRFVPATLQKGASEVQLCVEAMDLLHCRPDVRTFVILTGDRAYLPLVQTFKRYGRRILVVTLETPPAADSFEYAEGDVFLDFRNLAGTPASPSHPEDSDRPFPNEEPAGSTPRAIASTKDFRALNDPTAFRALEIAEEFFGQYEEIYLTPLLRKLSEILGEAYDPKSLISGLEAAGAVRLEKREGYPYDYTVLIMHYGHPDVQKVRSQLRRNNTGYGTPLSETEAEARSSYLDDYASFEHRMSETDDYDETTSADLDSEADYGEADYGEADYGEEAWEEEPS